MLQNAIIGAFIGMLVVLVMAAIGNRRKFDFSAKRPTRGKGIATPLSPEMASAALQRVADGKAYQVHEQKPGLVVLKDTAALGGLGFYYPIYVQPKDSGSELFVAVQPKAPQFGPAVNMRLKKAVAAVEKALSA